MPSRFYRAPAWRYMLTDLDFVTLAILDRRCFDRTLTRLLGQPLVITGAVNSDDPEINIAHTDGDAKLAEGVRCMFAFRREGGTPPWRVRGAGIVNQLEDAADSEDGRSIFTAADPWRLLYSRPVVIPEGTDWRLPGRDGVSWTATKGNVIVGQLLENTISAHGNAFIDAGVAYGGTSFYAGTIEDTLEIDINLQQGTMVGEAWDQLRATGTLDIVLDPIYDPINRPGYLCELSIYSQALTSPTQGAGSFRDNAVFGWDVWPKSMVGVDRMKDGARRANVIQFYAGQGGPPVTRASDAASIAKYGEYWAQQFFPGQTAPTAVEALAAYRLLLQREGRETVTLTPAVERGPVPFTEYDIGDRVPVFASSKFRAPFPDPSYSRVYGIPVRIPNDGPERVERVLASPGDAA